MCHAIAINLRWVLKKLFALLKPEHSSTIDVNQIITDVENGIPANLTTTELLARVADRTARLASEHPHYDILAAQVELENLFKTTPSTFSQCCGILSSAGLVTAQLINDVRAHVQYLDALANHAPLYPYTYSAVRTMEGLLLLERDGVIVERPSYMFLRVAVHLHGTDIAAVARIFYQLTQHLYVLDIATLANAGTHRRELSANYILSLETPFTSKGVYSSLAQTGAITDSTGDVSISFNASSSTGANQNGNPSQGLLPVLDLFNSALYVNLNGQVPLQSCMSVYIEPWHSDITKLLDVIKESDWDPEDPHHMRHVLWIPDLFMRRAHEKAQWSLFSPSETPFLSNNFGAAFDAAYAAYEADERIHREVVDAHELMERILRCQIQTGQPSVMFKDAANLKNNQKHLGVITHGGVNTDFVGYSSPSETGVIHSASMVLPSFIVHKTFDFKALQGAVDSLTVALNIAIDKSSYPTRQAKRGALSHRALGIGFEGLSDTFMQLDIAYDSPAARTLNRRIMETMYFASLTASNRYAEIHGCYPSYANSHLSNGRLQPDIWGRPLHNAYFDWTALRRRIFEHGTANSLLISINHSSDIPSLTGFCNNFEPIVSNIITRENYPRPYTTISPILVERLTALNIWSEPVRQQIINAKGSVQSISEMPEYLKALYKTAYELGPMPVVEMAVDRAPFVCQSQAMTIFMRDPNTTKLSSVHYLSWKNGLKTGMHILHTLPPEITTEVTERSMSPFFPSPENDVMQSAASSPSSPELELAEIAHYDMFYMGLGSDIGDDTVGEEESLSFVRFAAHDTDIHSMD
ncbi:hypothetical protein D9619_011736 [Psilocybe cf. subviscida]|uniref:Ribonucleoside-diphosphate reductase n=1 Tax=Psilocybe cf. subviscida TaxID=2480587 RepID=A0A8H5BSG1_9AGAR|nr:hypothetical protein D9619_011736 [Psilocybe cf. subviscida]